MTAQRQFDQAATLTQQGRLPEAERLLAAVLATEPRNFAAQHMTAFVRYQLGQHTGALTSIDAAIALKSDTGELFILRGVILHGLGRGDDAIASLTRATTLSPRDAQAWYNRGVICGELGRLQEAVDSYDKMLAIAPDLAALVNRAGALINLGRAAEALTSCDKALVLKPGYVLALCNRALALAALNRRIEAIAMYDQALAQTPGAADIWSMRGRVLHDLGRYTDALANFDRALALDAASIEAWNYRARSLFRLQRFDDSQASHAKAVAAGPPRGAPEWNSCAHSLICLKRYDDAVAAYDKALALQPYAGSLWSRRAEALRSLARFEEALHSADRALVLSPHLHEALDMRGRILLEMNRIQEGLDDLRRSGEMDKPTGPPPAYKALHDSEQADYLAALGIKFTLGEMHIAAGARLAGLAVNPANADIVAEAWAKSRPQIVVIDNLLTPEGLEALRRFCWGSTIWQRVYEEGYLGAVPETGFAAPLLAQIAEELRATFPTVIGDNGLRLLWGFKYDSRLKGINIHADQAAVNVNFWITPDDANLNPDRGGLVIYDAKAPTDWDGTDYNGNAVRTWEFLKRVGAKPTTVPYRANRAVIFDSDLFHETDELTFKEGYLNRRINCTMLFGRRTAHGT